MPRKAQLPRQWAEEFIQRTGDNQFRVDELVKRLNQEYTRGYVRAKRPANIYRCSWCGNKSTTEIHEHCQLIKDKL
jgi:hypothetical protein